jgi:hypothetical protein
MNHLCIFDTLKGWRERIILFVLILFLIYFVSVVSGVFLSWLGFFSFFGVWLKPVRDRFDQIDKECDKKMRLKKYFPCKICKENINITTIPSDEIMWDCNNDEIAHTKCLGEYYDIDQWITTSELRDSADLSEIWDKIKKSKVK